MATPAGRKGAGVNERRRPRVLVTRRLPQEVEARIARLFEARFNADDHVMSRAEILEKAQGCDGLLVTPVDRMDSAMITALPESVRIIATYSVGFDHIDLDAARKRGITVTHTPDVLTDATADVAMLLLLGAARGAHWGERMVREGRWRAWAPTHPLGIDVSGRRLGILGMGRIGRAVAKRARAFDMEIHYHNRHRLPPELEAGAIYHGTFEDMLPHCDFLSLNCVSTPETRGIINARTLAMLPKGAVLVNTARGDLVDDDALIAALQSGHVAAAGLDVFNNEPDIDPRYRALENVFLLPHLGSATPRTRTAMGMRAVDNLEAFFAGRRPGDALT